MDRDCVLPASWSISHTHRLYPRRPEAGVRSLGAGVADGCELAMWALGSERGSSLRALSDLNYWATSPALVLQFLPNWRSRTKTIMLVQIQQFLHLWYKTDTCSRAIWGSKYQMYASSITRHTSLFSNLTEEKKSLTVLPIAPVSQGRGTMFIFLYKLVKVA